MRMQPYASDFQSVVMAVFQLMGEFIITGIIVLPLSNNMSNKMFVCVQTD